jgi:hypothetical protein
MKFKFLYFLLPLFIFTSFANDFVNIDEDDAWIEQLGEGQYISALKGWIVQQGPQIAVKVNLLGPRLAIAGFGKLFSHHLKEERTLESRHRSFYYHEVLSRFGRKKSFRVLKALQEYYQEYCAKKRTIDNKTLLYLALMRDQGDYPPESIQDSDMDIITDYTDCYKWIPDNGFRELYGGRPDREYQWAFCFFELIYRKCGHSLSADFVEVMQKECFDDCEFPCLHLLQYALENYEYDADADSVIRKVERLQED